MVRYFYFLACLTIGSGLLTVSSIVAAEVYFETNFEDATLSFGIASPVWALLSGNVDTYGPGNFFEVVEGNSHSGQYSLRFNYEGRNGICNTCGSVLRKHKTDMD